MTDYTDSRWMPPSPHREAIVHSLKTGRAHIQERGHGLCPLFVYEDGGAMELSLMRLVDGQLIAVADAALPPTSTRHIDVCGTIDELQALWERQPELADNDPERLLELLDHAMGMLRRMHGRLEAYRRFSEEVAARVQEMERLVHPDHGPAPELHAELCRRVRHGGDAVASSLESMVATAEAIRKIAGDSEQVLYRYRDLAIEIGALYEDIRGGRQWRRPDAD